MTAQELINLVIKPEYQPFSEVQVLWEKGFGLTVRLKPTDTIPDDGESTTIFLHVSDVITYTKEEPVEDDEELEEAIA